MKLTFFFLIPIFIFFNESFEINFGKTSGVQNWQVITDNVMGGLSNAKIQLTKKTLKLNGTQSLENNGGFVSLKSPFDRYDLSGYETLIIRYKNTGIQFGFTLETDQPFYKPYYKLKLPKQPKGFAEVEVDLTNFKQYQMGEPTGKNISKSLLSKIIRIGFITTEKTAGNFELEIDYILFK